MLLTVLHLIFCLLLLQLLLQLFLQILQQLRGPRRTRWTLSILYQPLLLLLIQFCSPGLFPGLLLLACLLLFVLVTSF